jgi:putative flippase GtrA
MKLTSGQKQLLRKFGEMAFTRFLIAGSLNTGLTYLLYLGFLLLLPYVWAYTFTYVVGIVLGYALNARWVFRKSLNLHTATVFPLSYGFNYVLGVAVLWFLVEVFQLPKEIAPLVVVAISVPVMYIFTRTIFLGKLFHEKNNDK